MQPPRKVINEIQKGLEGLEMLAQWQLSLTGDLRSKAEAFLLNAGRGPPFQP
jgi:hypothetical protein